MNCVRRSKAWWLVAAAWLSPPTGWLHAADLPRAGGLESLPVVRTEGVKIANGDFEDGQNGWRGNPLFSVVPDQAHGGRSCLRFKAGPTKTVPSIKQELPQLGPGVHTLRFWVKMSQIASEAKTGGLRISIEYSPRAWPSTQVFQGTFDWQPVEFTFHLPKKMVQRSAKLSVGVYGHVAGGEAYFDDFTLERVIPPAVEAYLLYPNYRGYLPADGPQRVRVWLQVNQAGAKAGPRVQATSASGEEVAAVDLPAGTQERVVELDASSWPLGSYLLRARLGEYEYAPYAICKISSEQRKSLGAWFDEHNVLHAGGKAVFPIGFYNTVKNFSTIDDDEVARLDKLAEAPTNFNINYTWWTCSLADRKRYLGEMHRRGITYLDTLMPFVEATKIKLKGEENFAILKDLMPGVEQLDSRQQADEFLTRLAQNMRQLPGHGGWYVMDERPLAMVPKVFHLYTVLRATDPDHPTFGVSNRPEQLDFWRDTLDVFGVDGYPLMNMALGTPLTQSGSWTRSAAEATRQCRPVWTVIQFFQGWSKDRWPTTEELRTMSLMAITEGARGVFYWSFGQKGILWAGEHREEYWQRAIEVTKELKGLEAALVAPDAPEVVKLVSDARVRWRARAAGGKWYVFAYLPAEKFADREAVGPIAVTFTLQDGQQVQKKFRPDTADWFEATPRNPRSD